MPKAFCQQCSYDYYGTDDEHFRFIHAEPCSRLVVCSGCGDKCIVNDQGRCISESCLKRHGAAPDKQDDIVVQERGIAFGGYELDQVWIDE